MVCVLGTDGRHDESKVGIFTRVQQQATKKTGILGRIKGRADT